MFMRKRCIRVFPALLSLTCSKAFIISAHDRETIQYLILNLKFSILCSLYILNSVEQTELLTFQNQGPSINYPFIYKEEGWKVWLKARIYLQSRHIFVKVRARGQEQEKISLPQQKLLQCYNLEHDETSTPKYHSKKIIKEDFIAQKGKYSSKIMHGYYETKINNNTQIEKHLSNY